MAAELEIVASRVVAVRGDLVTVEFNPGDLPLAGQPLSNHDATLEVLRAVNPSEVICALRAGHAPAPGEVLARSGDLPAPLLAMESPQPQGQIATTHVGIDTLAPLFWRGSLAVYGDGAGGLVADLLSGLDPLVIEPEGGPGAVAMSLRVAIDALQDAPHRVVWLRDPARVLRAWLEVDGHDRPGDVALESFLWAIHRLCGLGALVADLPDRPDLTAIPDRVWTSVARLDDGALDLLHCRTRGPVQERRRKNISRVQKLLAAATQASDHAAIFGFEELDEDSATALTRAESLRDLLSGGQHSDLATLDDLLESAS